MAREKIGCSPIIAWSVKASQLKLTVKSSLIKIFVTYKTYPLVKEAVEKPNDEKMLTDITGKNLGTTYFKTRAKCYQDYSVFYMKKNHRNQVYNKGNYENMCSIIEAQVV